jgi:Flp pilus assembly pilin Flp
MEGGVPKVFLHWYTSAQLRWLELRERLVEDHGATAVEYAIMLAFIAAVIVGAVAFLGRQTNSQFQKVSFNPAP